MVRWCCHGGYYQKRKDENTNGRHGDKQQKMNQDANKPKNYSKKMIADQKIKCADRKVRKRG